MTRLRWLLRRRTNVDLTREIDAHIAERVDDLVEDGLTEADALTQAKREFGNARLQMERSREVWIAPWLTSIWQDLRYAVRSLARQPGFTLSAIGILAVGIGLVTALFTIFNAEVLRSWPVSDPSSIAVVKPRPASGDQYGILSNLEYRYLREHNRSFTHLATWMRGGGPVTYGDTTTNVQSNFVSANFFDMLQVGMTMGRTFLPDEEDYVSPRAVAIISERLWREFFGAPASIIGSTILVYDQPFVVVGVAEPGFFDVTGNRIDLWMPRPSLALHFNGFDATLKDLNDPRAGGSSGVAGRLIPGMTWAAANAELDLLSRQFRSTVPMESYGFSLHSTRPLSSQPELATRRLQFFGPVFGALFLVMLLTCANVGNLILARGLARRREVAIRLAVGASRARVVRQFLTESLVLSVTASLVALGLATLTPRIILRAAGNIGNPSQFSPDVVIFGFTITLALLACLVSGAMPALRTTNVNIAARAGERGAGRAGAGRLRTTLLATQLALSMVLLVSAGLLTRAIDRGLSFDPGFAINEVQALTFTLPDANAEQRTAFSRTLRDALNSSSLQPHAFSDFPAITGSMMYMLMRRADGEQAMRRTMLVRPVSEHYFRVTGIPLIAGRSMTDGEFSSEVVINESAARHFWPNESPLGKRLLAGSAESPRTYDIVGIAKDVPVISLTSTEPVVYMPSQSTQLLLVRDLSPAVVEQVASVARSIEPNVQVTAQPLSADLREALNELVFGSWLAWGIGLLALVLATIGAFGVFAYMVEERRREIGVRMALGARARQVVWTVVGGARWPLMFGLGAGLVLSLIAAPLLRGTLYGLSPFDPVTYIGIAAILTTAALVATWVPARRATHIDPAITLRGD